MPRRNIPTPALRKMLEEASDGTFMFLIEVEEASLAEPIRVADNGEAIVHNGDTYEAAGFAIHLPGEGTESIEAIQLQVANEDRALVAAVRLAVGRPLLRLHLIDASEDPDDDLIVPLEFDMERVQYDSLTLTGTLVFDDLLNERYPLDDKNPQTFPAGIYR